MEEPIDLDPASADVVSRAPELPRRQNLAHQYAAALAEWQGSGEAEVWDVVVGDGLDDKTSRLNEQVNQ
jgi:hypothetical protein